MTTRKILPLLLAAALTLAFAGCAGSNEPKDTPQRIGNTVVHQSVTYLVNSFEDVIDVSVLIADITIEEWLGEDLEFNVTFFKANINETIEGEEFETIIIAQEGTSERIYKQPLYKNGDRLFLFLRKVDESFLEWVYESQEAVKEFGELYENSYGAEYFLVSDIWEYENEIFLLTRFPQLKEWIEESTDINLVDEETRKILIDEFDEYDPLPKQLYSDIHSYVFSYDEIVNLIKKLI